jgi:monothiol glutaredoxin
MGTVNGTSLKLYIKPGCPWCIQAVGYLDSREFRYQEIDVLSDPSAYAEMRSLSGQSLTPTLVVNHGDPETERILPDFDVDELVPFLEEHGIGP